MAGSEENAVTNSPPPSTGVGIAGLTAGSLKANMSPFGPTVVPVGHCRLRYERNLPRSQVTAAHKVLARGTSMAEAAVALSRDFGLSRRQAYRYLEEAQAVAPPPVIAEASVTITLKVPRNIVWELRAYSASSGQTVSEIVRRAISAFLSAARGHG